MQSMEATVENNALALRAINTIRFLSVDAVQKAKSGHPGTPMGLAPLSYLLWTKYLRHNPANPDWTGRDRFVLSCGHASMLLYSLLHLTGYDLTLDDLRDVPAVGEQDPGAPRGGTHPGRRGDHGPVGAGARERRRDGDGRPGCWRSGSTAPGTRSSPIGSWRCAPTAT